MTKEKEDKKTETPLSQSAVEGFVMPEFGTKISVTQMFVRACKYDNGKYKYWKAKDINRTGIYLGKRKLANGIADYYGYDEGVVFTATEHIDAALVCFSERNKPVYVPLEAIKA